MLIYGVHYEAVIIAARQEANGPAATSK